MPRPAGPAEDLEERRRRGLALLDTGLSMNEVGRLMGVAPSSVMRWSKARDQFGDDGLKIRFSTGRPARLKAREHTRMLRMLKQGARSHGFDSDRWTIERVGDLIRREFGVEYTKTAVYRLLIKMGWEFRQPDLWCPAETP
jgi:transposase